MNLERARDFIPGTREISIGGGVVYRPIRSWHSGTYAGEKLESLPNTTDRSGCVMGQLRGITVSTLSYTVTHRVYWNVAKPDEMISCFLSYPGGMGCCDRYFWEALIDGEPVRFFDEAEAEKAIRDTIGSSDSVSPAK